MGEYSEIKAAAKRLARLMVVLVAMIAFCGLIVLCYMLSGWRLDARADELRREFREELQVMAQDAQRQKAVVELLMAMAAPPRTDRDEHAMFEAALEPYKDLSKTPCIRKLAFTVRRYRKQNTDAGRAKAWDQVQAAKRECDQ